jgi:hypothetical protein
LRSSVLGHTTADALHLISSCNSFNGAPTIPVVHILQPTFLTAFCPTVQVKFEPSAPLFAVHTECQTADGNTCRVSVGNIFKAENLKASQQPQQQSLQAATACALR